MALRVNYYVFISLLRSVMHNLDALLIGLPPTLREKKLCYAFKKERKAGVAFIFSNLRKIECGETKIDK